MATSYLGLENGRRVEKLAATTGGATDANKLIALDSAGKVPLAAMPNGIMSDMDSLVATESIAANAWVNVYSNAGVPSVRNATANAAAPLEAYGYVLSAVAAQGTALVYFDDNNAGGSGLTVGPQWLSATTPGASTATPPTGAGVYSQYLGVAVSPSIVHAAIERATLLAQ